MKIKKLAIAVAVAGTLASGAALAATQSVTANIDFDTALALTKNQDIEFGIVKAAQSGTYTISTAGVVTPTSGGEVIGGTPQAADITIEGSATQTIDITANNYAAENGVTPSAATCSYDGGAEAACTTFSNQAAPDTGTTLLVGVQVVADGTQTASETATPTFDIVVTYN